MTRKLLITFASLALLVGCGPRRTEREMMLEASAPRNLAMPAIQIANQGPAQVFSFSHTMTVVMSHDAVQARYDRARQACLRDPSLRCKLIAANISDESGMASAHLELALPHDAVASFEAGLLKPTAADKDGFEVRARSTQAQSVENEAGDNDKQVAQLTRYRDGLAALAQRPNLGVDDYIKVEKEFSETEASLDEALGQKRDISGRIARESLTVDLVQRMEPASYTSPLGEVWREAGDLFLSSTADVLRFVIQIVPWLPVGIVLFFLLRLVYRIARRRLPVAKSKEVRNGG
jgi:hypothetical protein